jgi:hypothetical protein
MRAANRKPMPKYMIDSIIERNTQFTQSVRGAPRRPKFK